jgi:hypothetical protein
MILNQVFSFKVQNPFSVIENMINVHISGIINLSVSKMETVTDGRTEAGKKHA